MDDPQVSRGSILQLRCSRCGALNSYKRPMVSVDTLNHVRRRLERLEGTLAELLTTLEALGEDLIEIDIAQLRRELDNA